MMRPTGLDDETYGANIRGSGLGESVKLYGIHCHLGTGDGISWVDHRFVDMVLRV